MERETKIGRERRERRKRRGREQMKCTECKMITTCKPTFCSAILQIDGAVGESDSTGLEREGERENVCVCW